ncbi:MAG: hypothetical protein ABSG43_08670 [Solirubrobacteraceae bacterium]
MDSASAPPSSSTILGTHRGIDAAQQLLAPGAVDHIDLAALAGDPEVREREPNLVAVARDG